MKKIVLLFMCLIAVVSFISCGKGGKEQKQVKKERVYAVVTDTVKVRSVQSFIETSGEVEARTNVDVFPEIGGKVASLSVEVGDQVKKGDIIAEVDPSKPGSYYSLSPVKSPITGTVTEVVSRPGTTVGTGTAIIRAGDIGDLVIYADIPERDVGDLRTGLMADIRFPAFPGEVFKGEIVRVSPVVDKASRSKQTEFRIIGSDSRINAGMFPKLKIYTRIYEGYVVIPDEAIVTRAGKTYVFLAGKENGGDFARRVEIERIATVENDAIIGKGIKAGDTIIVDGMNSLVDGARLNIIE